MRVGAPVQRLSTRKVKDGQIKVLVSDLFNEHPELTAPVTEMILRNDGMSQGSKYPVETIADDRRAQVPDVHLLGDVW